MVEEILDKRAELMRGGVTHRVGDIDRLRACFNDGLRDFREKLGFGARGILGRKLHVFAIAERAFHAFNAAFENLALRHLEFVLAMNRAGGEEHVDSRAVACGFHRLGGLVYILVHATRETGDAGLRELAADRIHGLEIAVAGNGKASLDNVHPKACQLPCHFEFLADVHGRARTLLAVA